MKLEKLFLTMDALFQGGRMFVGGISIIFMINRGLPPGDIAIIKTLQAVILFIMEIPTGILGDKYGRKFSLLSGGLSALIGFIVYLNGHDLMHFLVGEFMLALSLCWWSGAWEAWATSETKVDQNKTQTNHFFHLNSIYSQGAIVIFGWLGGILAGIYQSESAYVAAIITMLLLIFVILITPESYQHHNSKPKRQLTTEILIPTIREILSNKFLLAFTFLSIIFQFLIQPLLHYWQPLFVSLNPTISPTTLGNIFALSTLATVITSWLFKNLGKYFEVSFLLLWIVSYFLISKSNNLPLTLTLFITLMVGYIFWRTRIGAYITHQAPSLLRASIFSVISFLSRLGMIGSFFLIKYQLTSESDLSAQDYQNLFSTHITIFCILIGAILLLSLLFQKINITTLIANQKRN